MAERIAGDVGGTEDKDPSSLPTVSPEHATLSLIEFQNFACFQCDLLDVKVHCNMMDQNTFEIV